MEGFQHVPGGRVVVGEGFELEREKLMNIQHARLVLGQETLVLPLVVLRGYRADADQKFPP